MIGPGDGPIVGVFVGGRISWGKRWPARCFLQLVTALQAQGLKVVVFVGPEEKDLIGFFKQRLQQAVPVVYEPSHYTQVLFFLGLVIYAWFFPPSGIFADGTWTDTFTDTFGIASLLTGGLLRIWAVSHAGKCDLSCSLKSPVLVTTGPYSYIRHPIYAGDFLVALGMILLSDAFILIPLFAALFAWEDHIIAAAEEEFLKEKFGEEFDLYRLTVPKYVPRVIPRKFSLGRKFPLKELGTVWGIILAASFCEWVKSPLHRNSLLSFYHWLIK